MKPRSRRRAHAAGETMRATHSLAVLLVGPLVAGCTAYNPAPLDLAAHYQSVLERRADDPAAAALADSWSAGDGAAPFDVTDGVSPREAEAIALVLNPDLRAARAKALLCLACMGAAGAMDDPVLGFDLARIIESVDEPWEYGGVIGFSIPISGRLRLDKLHAEAEQAAELMRAAELEWTTRMDLRRAWAAWSGLRARADALRALGGSLDELLASVDALERAGELARIEARLVRIERSSVSGELVRAEREAGQQRLEVLRLMGLAPTSDVALTPALSGEDQGARSAEQTIERLISHHAGLGSLRAEYQVAERLFEWEVAKQYPDIEIGPGYGYEDGNSRALLGISMPLPIFNANRRGVAEAQTARDAMKLDVEALFERLVSRAAVAHAEYDAAREELQRLEQEVLPMVDAQYEDCRALARKGELSVLVLVESLGLEREARARWIEARVRAAHAMVAMTELAGPEHPGLSYTPPSEEAGAKTTGDAEPSPVPDPGAAPACNCPDCVAKARAAAKGLKEQMP